MSSIVKGLDRLQPFTLADLLGREDYVRLALASEEQIAAVAGRVDGEPTGTLADWRLVVMQEREQRGEPWTTWIHLLGVNSEANPCLTSPVEVLDLGAGQARTQTGSVYRLLGPRQQGGQPPIDHGLAVADALLHWGYGRAGQLRVRFCEPASAVRWGGWPRD